MTTIRILTTQNVYIDYQIANIGERILATLIDWFILIGFTLGIIFLSNRLIPGEISGWLIFIVIIFYDLVCEIFLNGQSIGKRARNIRVARLDGLQPTLGNYLLRWLLRPIDFSLSSGAAAVLSILLTPYGQRLGDLAAGTTVIKLDKPVDLEETIFTRVPEDHQLVYPQVNMLADEDITIVKEVLHTLPTLTDVKVRRMIVRKTAETLARKMNIALDMAPEPFLDVVLKDYNHFHGNLD